MTTDYDIRISGPGVVALETTVLTHGLPKDRSAQLIEEIKKACTDQGATPAMTGVVRGRAIVGLTDDEVHGLIADPQTRKVNTANLGLCLHQQASGATTVSTTLELAAAAGIRFAATGGIGGVHRGYATRFDVSADLAALARYPVALVASGAKSILDVEATREVLETLGVPVVGYRTDLFPAFYVRDSAASCDGRFDETHDLAAFARRELLRADRGLLIGNPIPDEHAVSEQDWREAIEDIAAGENNRPTGRDATPQQLAQIRTAFGDTIVEANIALLLSNVALAGALAADKSMP